MKYFLALCLIVLSAHGQDLPFFAKDAVGGQSSLLQPGMQFWWIATNLVEDVNIDNGVVTNWTDIISGSVLKTAGNTNVYKTSEGVRLGYNTVNYSYLTNTATVPLSTNTAWAFIIEPVFTPSYLGYHIIRGLDGANPLVYTWEGGTYQARFVQDDGSAADLSNTMIYTNLMDFVIVKSNSLNGCVDYFFTNGVFSASSGTTFLNANLQNIGGITTAAFNGFIKELQVYTNSTDWTLWASNFHVYRTNIYGQ